MNKIVINLLIAVGLIAAVFIGKYLYFLPKQHHGNLAPDFEIQNLHNQETMKLSDFRGRLVLLDFWGSWCGPCRVENPQLVKLYETYKDAPFEEAQSFEIISVGVERAGDEARWRRAIEKDHLFWPFHAFDATTNMRFFNAPIANLYGVKQVPTKFFIGEKGEIITVDPSMQVLEQLLRERIRE